MNPRRLSGHLRQSQSSREFGRAKKRLGPEDLVLYIPQFAKITDSIPTGFRNSRGGRGGVEYLADAVRERPLEQFVRGWYPAEQER